jgi:dihydrofolate reductase
MFGAGQGVGAGGGEEFVAQNPLLASPGFGEFVVNQYFAAGLVDALELHVVSMILGGGARLFENLGDARPRLELLRAVAAPEVTHLKYRVVKQAS